MSAEVMERVRIASGQTDGSLCLLLVLAEEADAGGVCRLGRKRLARRLGLSERETVELIRALEAAGCAARRVIANRVRARYGLGRRRGENRTPRGDSGVPWGAARDPRLSEVDDQGDIPDMRGDFYDPTGVVEDLGEEVPGTTGSLDESAPWEDFSDPGGVTWNPRGHIPGTTEVGEGGDSYDPTGVMRDPWGYMPEMTEVREGASWGDSYDPTGVIEGVLRGDSYDPTGVIQGRRGVKLGRRGVKLGQRGVIYVPRTS